MFDIDKQPSLSKPRDRHIKEDSENKAVFFLSQFKLSFLLAIGYTAKSHKQKPCTVTAYEVTGYKVKSLIK